MATTNDTVYVYNYLLNVWESTFTNINANVMATSIDPRTVPDNAVLMITGDYGGEVYEQDKGSTDATLSGGTIDAYGTISILLGIDKTDFVPRTAVVPIEAQTLGQLTVGYGFNGLTDVSKSVIVSETQVGSMLDSTFIMDTATLAGPTTLRQIIPILSNAREFSIQFQFRNQSASQPFTVHPIFLSDEVIA